MTYVSNWQVAVQTKDPKWYPRKTMTIRKRIMEEAYMEGYSMKQIAGYFKISLYRMYELLDVTDLKHRVKMRHHEA